MGECWTLTKKKKTVKWLYNGNGQMTSPVLVLKQKDVFDCIFDRPDILNLLSLYIYKYIYIVIL